MPFKLHQLCREWLVAALGCAERWNKAPEPQLSKVGTTVETREMIMVAYDTLHEHSQKVLFFGN